MQVKIIIKRLAIVLFFIASVAGVWMSQCNYHSRLDDYEREIWGSKLDIEKVIQSSNYSYFDKVLKIKEYSSRTIALFAYFSFSP